MTIEPFDTVDLIHRQREERTQQILDAAFPKGAA